MLPFWFLVSDSTQLWHIPLQAQVHLHKLQVQGWVR